MRRRGLLSLGVALLGLGGCSRPYPSTPGAVVMAALAAANQRNFEEAKRYLESQGSIMFGKKLPSASVELTPERWKTFTQDGRIRRLAVSFEQIKGDVAVVWADLSYDDNRAARIECILLREPVGWMMMTPSMTKKGW
ncbi:MAG: hypothetical protein JNK87_40895 [Bryobacterales bacterium]|nr:hypothetical protein [Bryobacterales bacterium]